jgi:hypothetical protein
VLNWQPLELVLKSALELVLGRRQEGMKHATRGWW